MRSQRSLSFRITMVLVSFAGLSMLGNGIFSYVSGRQAMEDATVSELYSLVKQKEASVTQWMQNQRGDIEILANSQDLLNVLSSNPDAYNKRDQTAAISSRLASILTPFTANTAVDPPAAIAIVNTNGTVIAATDSKLYGISMADTPEFVHGHTATYMRPAHFSRIMGMPVIAFSTPLKTSRGTFLGILISWSKIQDLNNKVTAKYDQHVTEDAYLIDRDGYYLTPPRLTKAVPLRDKADSEMVQRCLRGVDQVTLDRDGHGVTELAVCQWLPDFAIALIEKRNQREALMPVHQFGRSIFFSSLIVLLIATLSAGWLTRTVMRPIRVLRAGVERFSRGEYEITLPITSDDEVADLTREFNAMAKAILEKKMQLQANAAGLEQRVRERTSLLQQQANLLELAYDGIIVTDMARNIQLWNNGAVDMFGWSRNDAMGNEVHTLLRTRFPVPKDEIFCDLIRTGYWKGELRQRRRDGSEIVVATRKALQRNEAGEPIAILTVGSDITDRKRAEDMLRESEERTRRIVDSAYDAYVAVDSRGCLIDWNRQAEVMFGWPRHEVLGKLVYEVILPPRHRLKHEISMKDLITTGEGPALRGLVEIIGIDRSGREFPMELTISRIWHGTMPVFSAFLRDITRRKQSEFDLKTAKEAAEAATHAKSNFLANMSHEIRTPMNGIIGLTKLSLKTPLSPQQLEYLSLIEISAESLLHLVNDILDFSKLEARKLDFECIEFNVRDAIRNSLRMFSQAVSEKGLELLEYVSPDVPTMLNGDPGRLNQIIINLIGNAVKFTSHGNIVVRVSSQATVDGQLLLHLGVSDTGIGISLEKQAHIFDAFTQADTSTTRLYGGTGLGLAIVSQLTRLMQGSIQVESEVGKGTTFRLVLQFGKPSSQPPAAPHFASAFGDRPVLIVDDNATSRQILSDILRDAGLHAVMAECPYQARELLAHYEARPFALILLDSCIPGWDSFELARDFQTLPGAGKIVMMLSSPDFGQEVNRCSEHGLAYHLRKPITSSALYDTLLRAMDVQSGASHSSTCVQRPLPSRPLNVLIAEDHPINQRLLSYILAERGHTYAIANNGLEVLDMLEKHAFDTILMDGQMPEMDGYQATAEIRRREQSTGRHVRIIAVTAHAMRQEHLHCFEVGMDAVICKPIHPDRLLEILEAESTENIVNAGMPSPPAMTGTRAMRQVAFDKTHALERVQGKRTLLHRMIQAFLEDLPSTLDDIQTAAAACDTRALEAASHRLKGAASTLSAYRLATAAEQLELFGRRNETRSLPEAISELQICASELSIELESVTEHTL